MESMDPVSTIYYRALHHIDPQFTELLLMIPELRLPTRKAILSCCQMQMGPLDNPRLKEEFLGSFPDHSPRIYFQLRSDLSKFMVMNIINNSISGSHIKASILSSVLRSAPEVGFNDSDLAMQEGVMIDRSCSSYKLNMYVCVKDPPDYHVQVVDHLSPNIGPDFGAMLAGFDYVLPYI